MEWYFARPRVVHGFRIIALSGKREHELGRCRMFLVGDARLARDSAHPLHADRAPSASPAIKRQFRARRIERESKRVPSLLPVRHNHPVHCGSSGAEGGRWLRIARDSDFLDPGGCVLVQQPIEQKFNLALESLVEQVKTDRSVLAAILCGSLSHDKVWAKSDIDLVLVTIDDKKVQPETWL